MNRIYWVHLSYSRELQLMGYKPVARGTAFEAFELPKDEWHAFRHLFDPMPTLFTKDPDASN
jgi:hypothetical protein